MYYDRDKFDPATLEALCRENPEIASSIRMIEEVYSNCGVLSERRKLEQLRDFELQRLYSKATVRANVGPSIRASNFTIRKQDHE
jgi:hypothetical protein